jgi:hypothetical protein
VTISGTANAVSIGAFTTTGAVSMTKTAGTATFTGNVGGGAFTLNGAGGTLNLGTGLTHTFSGTFTRTNGTLNLASATLNINGTTSGTGGTWTPGTSTVVYGGGAQTIFGVGYYNLTLAGTGTKTLLAGTTAITGNLTLSGTALATSVAGLTISGNLVVGNGATFNAGANAALTVNGTTTIGGGTSGIFNITAFNSSPVLKGLVTVNSGATWNNSANSPVNFQGGLTVNGSFTPGAATQTFNTNAQALTGTVAFASAPVTITGITLTNNSTLTAAGTISGTGTLVNSNSYSADLSGAVSVATLTNAGTMTLSGANTSTLLSNSGTLTFSGSAYENPTTLTNSGTLNIITSGGFGTVTANFTNTGTVNFNGSGYITGFTNNAGGIANFQNTAQTMGTFDNATSSSILNVSALITGTGFINTLNATVVGNTVDYNGIGDQTIKNITYSNLILQGSGIKTFPAGTTTVNTLLSVEATSTATVTGTLTYGSSAMLQYKTTDTRTVGSEWPATFSGTGGVNIANTVGVISLNEAKVLSAGVPMTIQSTGSLSTSASNYGLTLGGAFTNSGTFTPNNSTITLSGTSAQAISSGSALTVYNLISNGAGVKTLTGTFNVSNVLTLTSGVLAPVSPLTLTSSSSSAISGGSSSSYINGTLRRAIPTGTTAASYVFPVGTSSLYLPFTLTNPVASAGETVSVSATASNPGGSLGASLVGKSSTEYWMLTSSNLTGGNASIARPSAISPYDVIGASATQTGSYASLGGTATTSSVNTSNTIGSNRYFVFAQSTPTISVGTISGSPFCAGSSVSVAYTKSGAFTAGNVFTAQLSDASGSFASPVTIGTTTSTTSGTISATIPVATAGGSGYRIRVVSSTPVVTSADNGVNLTVTGAPAAPSATGANICIGTTSGVTLSASGATSGEVYKWYDAASAGNVLKTSSSYTDNTYTTGVLGATTSFWVSKLGTSGCESARTQVDATYPSAYAGSQTLAGTDSWISHIYDGISLGTYYGTSTQAETFDQSFGGDATCFPFTAGANSYSIYTETFSVSNRMNSTKRGLYTADLGGDDGIRLYVDGNLVFNRWVDQAFTSYINVLMPLTGSSTLRYEYYENGGGNRYVFQNLTKIFDNTLSTNTSQSVYLGSSGVAISGDTYGTLPSGITVSGTGYQWTYSTTPGGARTAISGATGATYTPVTGAAPFTSTGTYYLYRNAVLTTTNNQDPTPYVATLESNACTLVVNTAPSITTGVSTLTGFTYVVNAGPSTQQSFSVTGANLVSNITVTPPTDFEISTTSGTGFQSTPITLTQSGGAVSATIYVRLKSGLAAGTYSAENIVLSASYATSKNVACTGTVTLPTYCTMVGTTTYQTSVTYVGLNTIAQTSAKPAGYSDYTSVSTSLTLGSNYSLAARINTDGNYSCSVRAWIDWNGDGDFADTGEAIDMGSATNVTNGAVSLSPKTITVPTTATVGQTRMRVAVQYNQYPTLCATGFDGEIEDYTLYIVSPSIATSAISGSPFTAGSSVSVPFTVTGAFPAGNIFTAQLSDASGSFSAPTSIGTLSGTGSGAITGTIPSVAAGTGYRIRVVSSNPVVSGSDNGTNLTIQGPGLYVTPSSLTGYNYYFNLGPSTTQSISVSGSGLTSNIGLSVRYGYFEISTSNSSFVGSSSLSLTPSGGVVATTPVYARLKSGLNIGSYTDSIVVSTPGFAKQRVLLTGSVGSSPNITVSLSALNFTTYTFGSGPSNVLSFTVRASRLGGNSVSITPPSGFEVSTSSGGTYQTTALTYAPDFGSDSLLVKTVYVRLANGVSVGTHTGTLTASTAGATTRNITCSGSVTGRASIRNSTSFLGSFLYVSGSGPSAIQGFKLDVIDLPASSTVTITPPSTGDFAVSRTRGGTFVTTALSITGLSGTFSDSIFVRMPNGKAVGSYGPEGIVITASGAVTKGVACSGKVITATSTPPTLATSVSSVTGFGYQYSSGTPSGVWSGGPSNSQSFVLSGIALASDATITAPTNFEISFSESSGFAASLNLARGASTTTIFPKTIYVRLKSGLSVASYSGNITISAGSASATVQCLSGKVYASPLISAGGGGTYCPGSTINLTSTGTDIESRYWEGPNGYYSILQNPPLTTNATTGLSGDYVVTGNVTVGGNLIYNGDFEQGNVGFGSAYGYPATPFNTNSLVPEGLYAITTTGSVAHYNFNSVADHSTTGSSQMIINGNTVAGAVVWTQNVSVLPNTDYQFTYWLQTVVNGTDPAPSKLQLYVNGVAAGPVYTANPASGNWTQYVYNTNSASASSINLELINQTIIAGGNDFSLDDIELRQILAAKDTATVVVGSNLPVSVALAVSQNPVNSGVPVTFTATPTNGGDTPTYAWYKNNVLIVGATASTYTYTPTNGDVIKCVLTSSLSCTTGNPANASITMVVNTPVVHNYWRGNLTTDWGTPANWTAGYVPAAGEDVEFATNANNNNVPAERNLVLDRDRTIGSLINATSLSTIVPASLSLVVNNYVLPLDDTDPNKIIIKASATLPNGAFIFHNAASHPVYATVEMYSKAYTSTVLGKPHYHWQYFGIPLASMVASPTLDKAYVRKYNENTMHTAIDSTRLWQSLSSSSTLVPFYGYEICQTAPKIYTFQGPLINQNFYASSTNYSVSATAPGRLPYTDGAWYAGQTVFANSYTAPIDIKQLLFGAQTEATVYQYSTGTIYDWRVFGGGYTDELDVSPGQYIASTVQTAGNVGVPRYVASMANMLIRAQSNSANATFGMVYNDVVRSSQSPIQHVKSELTDSIGDKVCTKILISGENGKDCVWLFTHENCSVGYDNGWDAAKQFGVITAPQIYTEGSDNLYQIAGLSNINGTKLGFKAGTDNQYTFKFIHNNISKNYQAIYLYDKIENKLVDITASGSEYSFNTEATPYSSSRFEIVARAYESTNAENGAQLNSFSSSNMIFFDNRSRENANVSIFDATGRFIKSLIVNSNSLSNYNVGVAGVYVVKMMTSTEETSKRLIVR